MGWGPFWHPFFVAIAFYFLVLWAANEIHEKNSVGCKRDTEKQSGHLCVGFPTSPMPDWVCLDSMLVNPREAKGAAQLDLLLIKEA